MRRKTIWFLGICLLCGPVLAVTAAGDGLKPIVTTDLLKIKVAGGLDLSPDGTRAVLVLTSIRSAGKRDYAYDRNLWMVDLAAETGPVQLTFGERGDSSPAWSPDSERIAFIRALKGKPQVWILPLSGGEAFPVTEAEFGASRPVWSPDGKRILYTSFIPDWAVEETPAWPCERPGRHRGDTPNWKLREFRKADAGEKLSVEPDPDGDIRQIRAWLAENAAGDNPRVFNRLNFQAELGLQTGLRFSHLFVADAGPGGRSVPLTAGARSFTGPAWSPDGKTIVCASYLSETHPDRVLDGDLWVVPADGAEPPRLLLDWEGHRVDSPGFSPDGTRILFSASDLSFPGYAARFLAVLPAGGGAPRPLTADFDRSAGGARWSPDGRWVYFIAADRGAFPLFRVSADGGEPEALVSGPVGIRDYDLAGNRLVYLLTQVSDPLELYAAAADGRDPRRISEFNTGWLKGKRIVTPREFWVERPDGRRVQAWVMEPAGREEGRTYPLALEIHGGPSSMWGPGEFSMWHEFQLLCGRGYGVVFCNPRGSGGYGFDFLKANYRDWGHGPAGDILAAAGEAAKLDWADPARQVVTGGSYAGYMTAWIVTQDHRFKAAVAQRGVYELSIFFGEGRAWQLVPYHFGGFPWDEEARPFLDANSPQSFVTRIRTPLLIIHSDRDIRTGLIQSEMLFKSLKQLGRPVEYVRYPDEGHELSRSGNPLRRMDRLNRILEFFERFVGAENQGREK